MKCRNGIRMHPDGYGRPSRCVLVTFFFVVPWFIILEFACPIICCEGLLLASDYTCDEAETLSEYSGASFCE